MLARRFGNPGRRIWYMCQGADPEGLQRAVPPPQSIGHGKVVPPDTRDREVLLTYLLHMSEKVGARLRRHRLQATTFFIGLRTAGGWNRWVSVPIKLLLKSFMGKDFEGCSHWYDLTRGQWIQGLVARSRHERRVYIVTFEPELADAVHERWLRIMSG